MARPEVTCSCWRCDACRHYTVAYLDRFLGDHEATLLPPLPEDADDRCVALVRTCATPWDKCCDCASHRAPYHGTWVWRLPGGSAILAAPNHNPWRLP